MWSPRLKGIEALVHTFLGVLRATITRPDILHIHSIGPALFTPLARYAVDYRYPGARADRRKAQSALAAAERIRAEVRRRLGLRPRA